jgi:hypothetical protein
LQDASHPVRQQIDRVAGAENGGDVAEEQRGGGDVERRSHRGGRRHDAARGLVALTEDPRFVVAMADGAAGSQRPLEVHIAAGGIAVEPEAHRLGRFENDERIDGAARAAADGVRECGVGVGDAAELRQRARLRAESRRPQRLVLATRDFRFDLIADLNDLVPVVEPLVVRAAGQLMGEIVPGAGGKVIPGNDVLTASK